MSDDIEALLRAELAGRAESAQPPSGEGLAEVVMARAGRIRRRRLGVAVGGLGLVLFGTAAAVWTPWTIGLTDAPLAATTFEEAQSELDIEFLIESEDSYGVVNADDEYIRLAATEEPFAVQRLQGAYVVSSSMQVEVTALDGTTSLEYEIPSEYFFTTVRSDAEAFAVDYFYEDTGRQHYDLFSADAGTAEDPVSLDLSSRITLQDWNDSLLVFSGDLISVSGGVTGTHHFNDQYDWGLESAAEVGYESVVVADLGNPDYVCVADLDPGVALAESEECGYLDDPLTEELISEASVDEAAPELVEDFIAEHGEEAVGDVPADGASVPGDLTESEYYFIDPLGRWQLAFSSEDDTWVLLDTTGDSPVVSELAPPAGALLPVVSHK